MALKTFFMKWLQRTALYAWEATWSGTIQWGHAPGILHTMNLWTIVILCMPVRQILHRKKSYFSFLNLGVLNFFCQTQLSRNSVILSLMFHFSLVALYHIMYNGEPIYKTKPKYFEMLIPFSWGVIYSLLCLWLCHHRLQPIEVATKQIYLLNSYLWLRILKYYAIRNNNNGYITKWPSSKWENSKPGGFV